MDVARLREQIPVCQRMVYVNTGWSGPSPVSVTEAIKVRLDYEMERGPTTEEVLESGRGIQARLLEVVGQLLNASPGGDMPHGEHHRGTKHRPERPPLARR